MLTCCCSKAETLSFTSSSPRSRWPGGQSGSFHEDGDYLGNGDLDEIIVDFDDRIDDGDRWWQLLECLQFSSPQLRATLFVEPEEKKFSSSLIFTMVFISTLRYFGTAPALWLCWTTLEAAEFLPVNSFRVTCKSFLSSPPLKCQTFIFSCTKSLGGPVVSIVDSIAWSVSSPRVGGQIASSRAVSSPKPLLLLSGWQP